MKFISILILLSHSIYCSAGEFGDLQPIPTLGNKWEVLTLGNAFPSKAEIVSIKDLSVTTKMEVEVGSMLITMNYQVKDEVCYLASIESYADFADGITHFKTEYSPKLRCNIRAAEMPYHEVFIAHEIHLNNSATRQTPVDRTYYYRGIENIITPSGNYTAEKIEIKGEETNRMLWRDQNNSLIKHEVKELETSSNTTTVLQKGQSQ